MQRVKRDGQKWTMRLEAIDDTTELQPIRDWILPASLKVHRGCVAAAFRHWHSALQVRRELLLEVRHADCELR
eukprot:7549455-Pyramimonas_sp.AAC.1